MQEMYVVGASRQVRGVLLVISLVASLVPFAPPFAPSAIAAGSPDIGVSVDVEPETLHGGTTTATITASNRSGSDGFNLSFRVVTPGGVSLATSGIPPSTTLTDTPTVGETTYFFSNYSDLPDGGDQPFSMSFDHDPSAYVPNDSFTVEIDAYVNSNERIVPAIDSSGDVTNGSGFAATSGSTRIIPFKVTKTEPSPETELLRGLHDHQTTYSITIDQAPADSGSGFTVEDWIPAGVEFLGCGGFDNSGGVEEYSGSGPISGSVVASCPTATLVETVDSGLPTGLPAGTYTHVVWDNSALAAVGADTLVAGGSVTFSYAAAIPMNENTTTWSGPVPPTTGEQSANVNNNNGASTAETDTERVYVNHVFVDGTYDADSAAYTDSDTTSVTAEDLAIRKTATSGSEIGSITTWTIRVRTSEYAASIDDVTIADTVPPALCPGDAGLGCAPNAGSPSLPYSTVTANADGTTDLTWDLGVLAANSAVDITYQTEQREFSSGGDPILAGDTWANHATAAGTKDGTTVIDESEASQTAAVPTLRKAVAAPGLVPMACGDGSGLSWDESSAGVYQPGDRVCWRLQLTVPNVLGSSQRLVDYLPPGFTYESWAFGDNNSLPPVLVDFDDSGAGSGVLVWSTGVSSGITPSNALLEVVISSIAGPPDSGDPSDLLQNLVKHSGVTSDGTVYFSRDDADAEWGYPSIESIDKSATATTVIAGDIVDFSIEVTNAGNATALDVEVWDVLPEGLECPTVTIVSDSGDCKTIPDPDRIEWTIPSIAPGSSHTVTYRVTIPPGVSAEESWTNTTGIRHYQGAVNTGPSDRTDYFPENNIDSTIDPADENAPEALDDWTLETPEIDISKTSVTSVEDLGNGRVTQATIGEVVDFLVEVELPGGVTIYDPLVRDVINEDYAYQNDALWCIGPQATPCVPTIPVPLNGGALEISGPGPIPIALGGELLRMTFSTVVEDVPANVRGRQIPNRATVRWDNEAGSSTTKGSTRNIRVVEPNLTLDKTNNDADDVVEAGQTLTWTVTVTNDDGPQWVASAFDVEVWDRLPSNLTCTDTTNISDGGQCSTVDGADYIVWTPAEYAALSKIERGSSLSMSFDVTMPSPIVAGTAFANTANVYATSIEGVDANERSAPPVTAGSVNNSGPAGYFATDSDQVNAPGLEVAKTVTPISQTIGEPVQYDVEVTIPADVVMYDVTVIDAVPTGIDVASSGYTTGTSCDMAGSPCLPPVSVTEMTPNGNDIGWWIGDQPLAAADARVITITYVGTVEDIVSNSDGVARTNTVSVYANQSDVIAVAPVQVPDAPNYDLAGPEAQATVTIREPAVTITKEVFDGSTWVDARRAVPNESLDYRLVLENTGNWPALDLVVSDTISTFSGDVMELGTVAGGAGYTVTDGDPSDGTLGWAVDGPLAPGSSITIAYSLDVWDADSSDEDPTGPEIMNTAALTQYWAVADPDPTIHREYADGDDSVEIELDLASIGDYVWFDINGDGVQDASEPPIENAEVTVTWFGPDGDAGGGDDETTVVTTSASGLYLAENLPSGDYRVEVTDGVPVGMVPSFDLDDGTSDPDGIWLGSLGEAENKTDVDFGYNGTGSIGDLVWFNHNGDGVQDPQEPGLAGVAGTVVWFGFNGVQGDADDVTYPFTTGASGDYLVESLPGGDYEVTINEATLPTGMTNNQDPDAGNDSTALVALGAGENNLDQDFGYAGDSSIGDLVWHDDNRDGIKQSGEAGLSGVTVELLWPGPDGVVGTPDDVTITDTTDSLGQYLFTGLNANTYTVSVVPASVPTGFTNTFDRDGDLDGAVTLDLGAGEDVDDVDFGYDGEGSIGDTVYWDLDGDGTQQVGEPGIPGVAVTVTWAGLDDTFGTADDVDYARTTGSSGAYLVVGLPPGEYRVTVSGSVTTAAINSGDPDGGADSTADLTLANAESNLDQDFGYTGDGSIGDLIWYDVDGDGSQDVGEPGFDGVGVTLTYYGLDGAFGGGDDVVRTVTTSGGGTYLFERLPTGSYLVEVDTDSLPAGVVATFDRDSALDHRTEIALGAGDTVDDADFGYTGSGEIGDFIWWDLDRDGTEDPEEPGWQNVGVTVTYLGADGTFGTADDATISMVTDTDGRYLAQALVAGDYRVDVEETDLPADVEPTASPGTLPFRSFVTLGGGESNVDQDFGYAGINALGDYVWLDANADAVQDASEPGAGGVSLMITWGGPNGTIGDTDDVSWVVVTGSDGIYGETGLVSGLYEVRLDTDTLPDGWVAHSDLDGADPAVSEITFPSPGPTVRDDVDFGLVGTATLEGNVWHDVNGDAVNDALEFGLTDVTVTATWHGPDGDIDFVFVTNALGDWALPTAPPGDYTTVVDVATVNPAFINSTPLSVDVGVPPAGSGYVEHGFVGPVEIGSLVWIDTDGNGVLNGAEQGIAGVTVELVTSAGSVFTVTDSQGRYLFTDQLPGTFTVKLDASTIPDNLEQTYSKDGSLDLETEGTADEFDQVLDVNFGFQEVSLPVTGGPLDRIAYLSLALLAFGTLAVLPPRRRDR